MQVAGYRYDTKTDFYDNDREGDHQVILSVCVWMVPYRKSPQKHSNPKLFHNFAKTIKTQRI